MPVYSLPLFYKRVGKSFPNSVVGDLTLFHLLPGTSYHPAFEYLPVNGCEIAAHRNSVLHVPES